MKGFQSVGATKPSGKTATELKEHDYFYGSTLNYDKAGHVTGVTETLYRLPQTTVTDDITDLKADMGYGGEVSGHGPKKTVVEIETQSNSNKSRLDTLNDYIADDWTNIANGWADFKPSVQNVIGDMDNLYTGLPSSLGTVYKTHYNSSSSPFKNLVSVIGKLNQLYSDFDPNNKKARNIIEAIVELSNTERNNQSTTQTSLTNLTDSINDINGDIGTRDTRGQIYTEINNLYTTINNLDYSDSSAADSKYVSKVTQTDGKIAVTHKSLPTYSLSTGTTNGTVAFNGTNVAVQGLKSAAYTDSNTYDPAGAADAVNTALQAEIKRATEAEVKNAEAIKTLSDGIDPDKIDGVKDLINYVEEHGTEVAGMKSSIDTNTTNLETEIKRATAEEEALNLLINTNSQNITKLNLAEDGSVAKAREASSLDSTGIAQVEKIKVNNAAEADMANFLGEHSAEDYLLKTEATGYNDILTKTEAQSIYIKQITSGAESGTIAVDGIDVAVTNLGSAAFTDSADYDAAGSAAAAIEAAATDATTKVDALKNGDVKTNANAIATIESDFENITTIIGDVSNLENAPEGGQDVLSWLTHLSTELVRIKQKINELHTAEGTDVPFPEVENSQSSEEEEEVITQ